MKKLGDVFKISKGKKAIETSNDTGLRYIQIGDLRNDDVMKYTFSSTSNVLCNKDDVLIAWDGANAGTVGYNLEGVIGSTLAKLTPKIKEINSEYVGRFLQSKFSYLRENCTGATIPHLSRPILEGIQIPLPSLPQQQKIANILDAADALRQNDKALIAKYDELTQALFLDMFGNLLQENKNCKTLEEICGKGKYGSGASACEFNEGNYRYLRITDINNDGSLNDKIMSPDEIDEQYVLSKGDLVFARTGATVGKTYLYNENDGKLLYAGYLIKFNIPNPYRPEYFFYFTKTARYNSWVLNQQNVVAQPNINAKQYGQELNIPIPTINLQNQFAERVAVIEEQKAIAQQELAKSEELFNSLLQKAFKGELN